MLDHITVLLLGLSSMALSTTSASPSHITPIRRQEEGTITASSTRTVSMTLGASSTTSDSSEKDATAGSLSITIIIPIAAVFGLLIVLSIGWCCRKRLLSRIRGTTVPPSGNITAEELASGRRSRSASTDALTGTSRTANSAAATRGGAQRGGGRGARRNVRRTESGRSIRTLPEYSKEAGDEELVLVRQRSASSIGEEDEDELEHVSSPVNEVMDPLQRNTSHRSTRSNRSSRSVAHSPVVEDPNGFQEIIIDGDATPPSGSQSAPLRDSNETPRRSQSNASRRGWGEAPTYLEAMSSPSFLDSSPSLEAGVPPPRTLTLRDRTSTSFRGFLNKAGAGMSSFRMPTQQREMANLSTNRHSSTSLLLQPQTSRLSTLTSDSREGSSSYMSPWASTHSLLHISSPVPNTAVRASFDSTSLPKAGLSNDQMKFLSSSEAVNLVGVKLGDVPASKRRRRSEATSMGGDSPGRSSGVDDLPPPSWEDIHAGGDPVGSSGPSGSGADGDTPPLPDVVHRAAEPAVPKEEIGSVGQANAQQSPVPMLVIPSHSPSTAATTDAPSVEIEPPTPTVARHTPASPHHPVSSVTTTSVVAK